MTPSPSSQDNPRVRVISIRADETPNVRTGEEVIPGIVTLEEYNTRRSEWDEVMQCVGLDGEFWEGAQAHMFPPEWLAHSKARAEVIPVQVKRREAKGIGVDTGQGKANTAWCVVDEWGVIDLRSIKTRDTSVILPYTISLIKEYGINSRKVCFDRGGGGKEHADYLRRDGYKVRTVGFGDSPTLDPRRGLTQIEDRMNVKETRSAYKDKRTEMYAGIRRRMNPNSPQGGYGIPAKYTALFEQLAPIPLIYNGEGRMELLPKHPPSGAQLFDESDSPRQTLTELIGHSPDEADSLALAIYAMEYKGTASKAGAIGKRL